jgi:hypothetical protein
LASLLSCPIALAVFSWFFGDLSHLKLLGLEVCHIFKTLYGSRKCLRDAGQVMDRGRQINCGISISFVTITAQGERTQRSGKWECRCFKYIVYPLRCGGPMARNPENLDGALLRAGVAAGIAGLPISTRG